VYKRQRSNLRLQDTAFRYGGEEFVIILNETTPQEADLVAQRLNTIVKDNSFAIDSTLKINVTISLGVTCLLPTDDEQGVNLLHRADTFLLQAKSKGRNRVVSSANHIQNIQNNTFVSSTTDCPVLSEINHNSKIQNGNCNNHNRAAQTSHLRIAG